jgi:hypothetical protein
MSEQIQELFAPLMFTERVVGEALDNFDPADPHRRQDEYDDKNTAPLGNQPFYDTSTSTPIQKSNVSLQDFPDYSDKIMTDYRIKMILGQPTDSIPNVVDLDTAPNYVNFIKNSIRNVIASESEFDINKTERRMTEQI